MSAFDLLVLEKICRTYDRGGGVVHALCEASFALERAELCALVGPSGSGKSSLMNIVGLLDAPSGGRLHLDGRDITRLGRHEAAALRNDYIGFVFQSFELLPRLTALQNVALPLFYRGLPRRRREDRALEMLAKVGLSDRAGFRPHQLSGGQRQRVAIARALVGEPVLILADEPTGSLDSATSREIMDLFVELNRRLQVTFLLVTHDLGLAARCDRRIELLDGRIVRDSGRRQNRL